MNVDTLKPSGDHVLILAKDQDKTPGGIILTQKTAGTRFREAEIKAVGPEISSHLITHIRTGQVRAFVDLDKGVRLPDVEGLWFLILEEAILAILP